MAHRANKRPPGRIKSSIVARLNTRLFFRLLGIYFTMDLLLLFLFCGGLFVWSEQQAAQISTLVKSGRPLGGGHGVDDGRGLHRHRRHAGGGRPPPARLAALAGGDPGRRALLQPRHGGSPSAGHLLLRRRHQLHPPDAGDEPYAIRLDLTQPAAIFVFAARCCSSASWPAW
ncbi:MAG: hypothetical protein ACLRIS_18920 [Flavonifractor plautii]